VTELLRLAGKELADKFDGPMVAEVSLKLNPYRKIAMDCEDWKMVYFSEKFEFAAMHKLWNDKFSDEKNFEVFGKCANPAGHGHNYTVEVTVKMGEDVDLCVGDFERIVDGRFIELVDHKNLNVDIDHFAKLPATVENIAVLAWEKLNDQFKDARLHSVTVWETDKTNCTYYG
jgi:6-pyruvoyltetrahydropterin/6-carboxytetrahydropterin synthase